MKHLTDAQQQLVITTIAKVPVPEARPILLAKLGRRLPDTRVSDEQLLEAINSALKSFPSGAYVADEHGAWRAWDYIDPTQTLKEAAAAYLRQLAINKSTVQQVCWPPYPPRPAQPAEPVESYTQWAARVSPEEHRAAAAEWARFIGGDEAYERVLREQPEPVVEVIWDPTQPPPDRPVLMDMPPENIVRADNIADLSRDGSVEPDAVEDELPSPYFSDWGAPGRDNRGRPLKSAYAEVSELSKRRKRGGLRRLRDISKVFFK